MLRKNAETMQYLLYEREMQTLIHILMLLHVPYKSNRREHGECLEIKTRSDLRSPVHLFHSCLVDDDCCSRSVLAKT